MRLNFIFTGYLYSIISTPHMNNIIGDRKQKILYSMQLLKFDEHKIVKKIVRFVLLLHAQSSTKVVSSQCTP